MQRGLTLMCRDWKSYGHRVLELLPPKKFVTVLMIFTVREELVALPVFTVPPAPALLPPVFELDVVLLMTVELLLMLIVTDPGYSHVVPFFTHLNFLLSLAPSARMETSTVKESVCASLPSALASQPIAAVAAFTVRSPAHHVMAT